MLTSCLAVVAATAMGISSGPTCSSVTGVILGDHSDLKVLHGLPSLGACCASCNDTVGCVTWTWHPPTAQAAGSVCYLHKTIGPTRKEAGVTSGVPRGPLPPVPPPSPPPSPSPMGIPSGPDACSPNTNGTSFPFCDSTKTMAERVGDTAQFFLMLSTEQMAVLVLNPHACSTC
jgi:hypothetical protein